ncbi:MAG TPA: hydroxyethylthiazole kinase [Pseudolabrys sp.]|nr:hydroxyethylthiazole kinase [Pseudolabrys sp.]
MRHPQAASRERLSGKDLAASAVALLMRLREKSPRVHCVTNSVAQNFTANALLAFGAIPSMTLSGEEIGAFVAKSDALLVNLGTFDRERREATSIAVDSAVRHELPWVLDPVFVDRAPQRAAYARDLIFLAPKALRLNAAEFAALAGGRPDVEAVAAYACAHDLTVGLSGKIDLVADGGRAVSINNGHALMAKVTAMGCAASALVAACLAVEADAFIATTAALAMTGIAGEVAAEKSQGPGSFAVAIVDALYNLDEKTLLARANIGMHEVN